MKLLLYCNKAKPYLFKNPTDVINQFIKDYWCADKLDEKPFDEDILNGKIVAECDYEVEWCDTSWYCNDFIEHKGLEKSCLKKEQLFDYVKGRNDFYAIHIKNLHIFDKPKELNDYDQYEYERFSSNYGCIGTEWKPLKKAPQNMMYCYDEGEKKILISIRPEWLCKILNGEKTIEVRKKVLKEML